MNKEKQNCIFYSGVVDESTYGHECMWNETICETNTECLMKHPIKLFFSRLKFFFNFKNKWYGINLSYINYKRDIISFKECLKEMWHILIDYKGL